MADIKSQCAAELQAARQAYYSLIQQHQLDINELQSEASQEIATAHTGWSQHCEDVVALLDSQTPELGDACESLGLDLKEQIVLNQQMHHAGSMLEQQLAELRDKVQRENQLYLSEVQMDRRHRKQTVTGNAGYGSGVGRI